VRVQLHFTPTYSSWLNQVEIWFAKIEREVIARGIFTSVPDLARKLRRYINAYSANARPIQWKYSDSSRRLRTNEFTATVHWFSNRSRLEPLFVAERFHRTYGGCLARGENRKNKVQRCRSRKGQDRAVPVVEKWQSG